MVKAGMDRFRPPMDTTAIWEARYRYSPKLTTLDFRLDKLILRSVLDFLLDAKLIRRSSLDRRESWWFLVADAPLRIFKLTGRSMLDLWVAKLARQSSDSRPSDSRRRSTPEDLRRPEAKNSEELDESRRDGKPG